jgi:hypothetical protein
MTLWVANTSGCPKRGPRPTTEEHTMIIESPTRPDAKVPSQSTTTDSRAERHERAVAQTLRWAQEAAVSQCFDDALDWLQTVAVVDGPLSPGWQRTQASWRLLAAEQRVAA